MIGSGINSNSFGEILRGIKKRREAAKRAANTTKAEGRFLNAQEDVNLLAEDDFGGFDKRTSELNSLKSSLGATNKSNVVDKKKIDNLLRASGQREAQLRAKKAAPGFSNRQSLVQ